MSARRIALACMTPVPDTEELGSIRMPSYGVRRILAAVVADPALADARLSLVDFGRADVQAYVDALLKLEPDLLGLSVYVWSMPLMTAVARRVKAALPHCTIVFGGPSARPAAFDLAPYAPAASYVDALVVSEGEHVFCEIARLPERSRSALRGVAGLHLPTSGPWIATAPRPPITQLDDIASPSQLGLMPEHSIAYLETYRGCPMSCSFCEWGASESARTVFSVDYLERELQAFAAQKASTVFLLDAGLNLNAKGFQNLVEADRRVGLLRSMHFWAEIYPTHVKPEHLDFLSRVGTSYLGVGLQSLDAKVLKMHNRPFDPSRFERVLPQLAQVARVEIQVIFGLPGDTPEGFRRTLAYARSFGVHVRAYHCLVLPDALLTRSRPEWALEFDPLDLSMRACLGWSAEDLAGMRCELDHATAAVGGESGNFWWSFPPAIAIG